jgi:signal transduction histidine kinase
MLSNYSIFDNISTGIFIIDSDYKVVYWNSYLEDWTSIDRIDILGEFLYDFFPSFNNDGIKIRLQSVFEYASPVIFSSKLHENLFSTQIDPKANTNVFEVTVTGHPDKENSNSNLALFTVNNVSDLNQKIKTLHESNNVAKRELELREEAEIALFESTKLLEKRNIEKDTFISILAHDLINALGGSIPIVDLLESRGEDWKDRNLFISELGKNTKAAYNLLSDLIAWGQASLGKQRFVPSKFGLYDAFNTATDLYHSQLVQKKLNMLINCDKNLVIQADPNLIAGILRNLVKNAIKYTEEGGTIKLEANSTDERTEICISDTGRGMTKEKAENIFSLDKVKSEPGTDGERGTGLGLQIVNEYVAIHGGKIRVESELGKGTSVFFTIPASDGNSK